MTYTSTQTLTFDEFIAQHGDHFRYFIGKPKQPTFTVCRLEGEDYIQQQYRLGQPIFFALLPALQLRLDDILPRQSSI
jgi:Uma2 family endonuclease